MDVQFTNIDNKKKEKTVIDLLLLLKGKSYKAEHHNFEVNTNK
jgi:hypothetical protein